MDDNIIDKFYSLKNKNVLITGASSGIGYDLAKKFSLYCSNVLVINRSECDLPYPDNVFEIISDLRDTKYIQMAITDWIMLNGNIHILINNAGILIEGPVLDVTHDSWLEIININVLWPLSLTKFISEKMIESQIKGSIIFAGSFAAQIPSYPYGVYAATKKMIISIVQSLAAEMAPKNIRVNAYSPGVIDTKMTSKNIIKNHDKLIQNISMNRIGLVDEVSKAVLFLASDSSSYITGHDLQITGGKLIIQNQGSIND